jgi:hypothetical protein
MSTQSNTQTKELQVFWVMDETGEAFAFPIIQKEIVQFIGLMILLNHYRKN